VTRRIVILASLVALLALVATGPAGAKGVSRLIAKPSVCPAQHDLHAPAPVQERAMRCMTNYARRQAHRPRLRDAPELDRSAEMKSRDIVRCDSFSHFACGRSFTYWMQQVGYLPATCWRAGENIAWGNGSYGTVRSIFSAWMHSAAHRENILSRSFDHFGVGLEIGALEGYRDVHVWVQHFGRHC
jgi:uncharacterized protein YkwD